MGSYVRTHLVGFQQDDSAKQELKEYGDLLINFFRGEEKGKEVLEAVDDYSWKMLD